MSATVAEGSVQTYARHPVGSSTGTTRITPPAGFQVAGNDLDRLGTRSPSRVNASVVHPRRRPARLARLTRSVPNGALVRRGYNPKPVSDESVRILSGKSPSTESAP
jgi:hypothetical protein